MDYRSVTVAIRQRTELEAIDLGFACARRWFPALEAGLAAASLPAAALLFFTLPGQPLIAAALFWWLKPLYDRLPLFFISRALFGQGASLSSLLEIPRFVGAHLAGDLSYRRLAPWRYYTAPVRQLEGLRGRALSRRTAAVAASGRLVAALLALVCQLFTFFLAYGLYVFFDVMLGSGSFRESMFILFTDPSSLSPAAGYWLLVLATVFVEPFCVAAGFGLYINRRINLEGWDIELVFRRLAERIGPPRRRGAALPALLLLCLAAGAIPAHAQAAPGSGAQEPAGAEPAGRARIEEAVREVLAGEQFGRWEQRTVWVPRWQTGQRRRSSQHDGPGALSGVAAWLSRAAPWVLGGGALIAILYLLALRSGRRPGGAPGGRGSAEEEQAGTAGPPEEPLPRDWVQAAERRWRAGEPRAALSLLYRGTLMHLVRAGGAEIPDSATEAECVARTRRSLAGGGREELAGLLEKVARLWLQQAYAQRPVSQAAFRELCELSGTLVEDGRASRG